MKPNVLVEYYGLSKYRPVWSELVLDMKLEVHFQPKYSRVWRWPPKVQVRHYGLSGLVMDSKGLFSTHRQIGILEILEIDMKRNSLVSTPLRATSRLKDPWIKKVHRI